MRTLTPAERRAFRAKAHHLHPFVIVGQHGLTPAVLHEIDVNLLAHELIKIRVSNDDRGEREALLARISDELDAAPVQHLGKILTLWRPSVEPLPVAPKSRSKAAARTGKPARSKPDGDERRTWADRERPRAGKPKTVSASPESQRRKRGPRGGTAAPFAADPAARRRKPEPPGGTAAPFATDSAARRRKPGPRGGTAAPFATDPAARRRKPVPPGGTAAPFAADPAARRRRAKR
jgi:putative YhbY family RNA-binding protein